MKAQNSDKETSTNSNNNSINQNHLPSMSAASTMLAMRSMVHLGNSTTSVGDPTSMEAMAEGAVSVAAAAAAASATMSASPAPSAASATTIRPGPLGPNQKVAVVRMNLFVLVRILLQYLERVDKEALGLAKEILKDCERKHKSGDSKYGTLADAINERLRDAVGETHWTQARRIQQQLVINQQVKKLRALKAKTAMASMKLNQQQVQQALRSQSMRQDMGIQGQLGLAGDNQQHAALETPQSSAIRFPMDEEMTAIEQHPSRLNHHDRQKQEQQQQITHSHQEKRASGTTSGQTSFTSVSSFGGGFPGDGVRAGKDGEISQEDNKRKHD